MYYLISGGLLLVSIILYNILNYYTVFNKRKLIVSCMLLVILIPQVFNGYFIYVAHNNKFIAQQKSNEFKSNQDSQYSQLWLDYLSYRDSQVGRVGSEENFSNFLSSKSYTEEDYAREVITGILTEQGLDNIDDIVNTCIEENIETITGGNNE